VPNFCRYIIFFSGSPSLKPKPKYQQQVDKRYGMQVFNRKTYRPKLTAEGRILIAQIRRLLKQAT